MREIRYSGGMLVFHLPESWKEEYHRDGAAYYEGDAEGGSLNVSLTTVRNNETVNESMVRSVAMTDRRAGEAEAERLENGNFLRRFERPPSEGADPLHVIFWVIANAVPPNTVRYAVFNFGALPAVVGTSSHVECLAMLDQQIRRTTFTTLTPEEVRALQKAVKPWYSGSNRVSPDLAVQRFLGRAEELVAVRLYDHFRFDYPSPAGDTPFSSFFAQALELGRSATGDDPEGFRTEFVRLVEQAQRLAQTKGGLVGS